MCEAARYETISNKARLCPHPVTSPDSPPRDSVIAKTTNFHICKAGARASEHRMAAHSEESGQAQSQTHKASTSDSGAQTQIKGGDFMETNYIETAGIIESSRDGHLSVRVDPFQLQSDSALYSPGGLGSKCRQVMVNTGKLYQCISIEIVKKNNWTKIGTNFAILGLYWAGQMRFRLKFGHQERDKTSVT